MKWKELYTKLFLVQLGMPVDKKSIKEHYKLWWKNTREKPEGGLRLTDQGYETLQKIDLAMYEVFFPSDMAVTTQVIIFLDKFINCPYYLKKDAIVVTNERKAIELSLFSGDIRKYGSAKAVSHSQKSKNIG
jgi:hypothetical protein